MKIFCKSCLTIRRGFFLATTMLLIVMILYFAAPDVLELAELHLLDLRMKIRGPQTPETPVKLIFVDTSSRIKYGTDNEFRDHLATIIDGLCANGVRAIGLDLFFIGDSTIRQDDSRRRLAESMRKCGNVVTGFKWQFNKQTTRLAEAEAIGRRRLLDATRGADEPGFTPDLIPKEALISDPAITRKSAAVGYFTVITDPFQQARKIPAALSYEQATYYPFSMALVRVYLQQKMKDDSEKSILESIHLAPDAFGYLWFNHYGTGDAFESIRFDDVVQNGVSTHFAKDSIVIFGVSGEDSGDQFSTSFDPNMPGVILHATAAANILSNRFLRRDIIVRAIEISIMAICALIMGLMIPRLPPSMAIFLGPILVIFLVILSEGLLAKTAIWLHLITPMIEILLLHLVLLSARMRLAEISVSGQNE